MAQDLIVAKVDNARRLLAEARDATDAKKVADLAHAAEVYARRQRLSEEVIGYATAVKVDALTLMGEFLKAAPKNKGANGVAFTGSRMEPVKDDTPTLKESGISKKESSAAQALDTVKEANPELHEKIRTGKAKVAQAVREVQRRKKRQDMEARGSACPPTPAGERPWKIIHGDWLAGVATVNLGSVRLAFLDPPYNIGVDYGDGAEADLRPDVVYLDEMQRCVVQVKARLTPDGSLWVLIGDEYAAEFCCVLKEEGFHVRNWIVWYETFGVNCQTKFNRTKRHLFYSVVDPKRFVFHSEAVTRPSDRQTKYDDARADPGGKIWDDVWQIPRLVGTATERIPEFPTQLPLALLRPVIACATDPGDLVLDPFCGSATTGAACLGLGRRFVGVEKQAKFHELAELRLKGTGNESGR